MHITIYLCIDVSIENGHAGGPCFSSMLRAFVYFIHVFTCVLPVHDQSMEAELQTRFGLPDGLSMAIL